MATKVVNVRVDEKLHVLMRQYCVLNGKTSAEFIEEAMAKFLNLKKDEEGKWIEKSMS